MIVVMGPGHTRPQLDAVIAKIEEAGLRGQISEGVERIVVGVVGDSHTKELLRERIEAMPGVENVVRILQPYKLVSREFHGGGDSTVWVRDVAIGGGRVVVIAGPCSVESREQALQTAHAVKAAGAQLLRGGAFKPRTSPYSFQGLEEEALRILVEAREATGLPIVTEAMDARQLEMVVKYADMVQIGARNMQNYTLLRDAGRAGHPVMLKRGPSATIEEWLLAAEYIMAEGNPNVVLCERGIRTFENYTRFTLDLNAVPVLKRLTHLPVLVDPCHGTGKWELVTPMARASVAAGADGLLVEVHPEPDRALSDGPQQLTPENFAVMMQELDAVALAVGRRA
ncbi:MAG: 3-deoxy-7-phosphoheptulonate synthase [Bacillati bacterium ANGP1]|uniref:3-deoxy-7-phosphoheptulonate synthase n=1 Tax=Candidatus Segetimicrobium genomatis TaxID=2569760 RepID=A0A537KEP8_9BACT|nr:MAG: 3-deoxy-7-phosphoheptulonate synthase [Terrabacteria group bacterium ANGP1]